MPPTTLRFEHWSLAGDAVLEGCRIFRRQNLIGGNGSLGEGLEVSWPYPTSCLLSLRLLAKYEVRQPGCILLPLFCPRHDELYHLKL